MDNNILPGITSGEFSSRGTLDLDENRLVGLFPDTIKCIGVMVPASVSPIEGVEQGIRMLKNTGKKVKVGKHIFEKAPDGAQSILVSHRVEDFLQLWNDPEIDLLLFNRGGTGSADLVSAIPWDKLPPRPNLLVQGFSDITTILGKLLKLGYGHPITGPNVGVMRRMTSESIEMLKSVYYQTPSPTVPLMPLYNVQECSGLGYGAHLTRMAWLFEGGIAPDLSGRVIFLECVNKTIEHLLYSLNILKEHKVFEKCRGVVLCHFKKCEEPRACSDMLRSFFSKIACPVFCGYPYGHNDDIFAIDYQRTAEISNQNGTWIVKSH